MLHIYYTYIFSGRLFGHIGDIFWSHLTFISQGYVGIRRKYFWVLWGTIPLGIHGDPCRDILLNGVLCLGVSEFIDPNSTESDPWVIEPLQDFQQPVACGRTFGA